MKASRYGFSVVFVSAVALVLAGGCGSKDEGRQRSGAAVGSLKQTRTEIAGGQKQVDEVLAAAGGVQSGQGDLAKAYDKYKKEVTETEQTAKGIRGRADDMRARSKEYQAKWHDETSKVNNPDLMAAAQARAANVRSRYDTISTKAQDARTAYEPFIRDLKDLQTYLANDLTPGAVQAARPVFDKIQASGQNLKQRLAAMQKELDDVATEMSPTAAAASK